MSEQDRTKWDARFRKGSHLSREASPFLDAIADLLPQRGRALDIAGGAGRNALWLARRGLEVTITDISEVGLGIAAERAAAEGLALTPQAADLESDPLPTGPWDVITSFMFLSRPLFAQYPAQLAPGGLLVVLQPTVVNLERHPKPPRPFLLEPGELRELAGELEIVRYEEAWMDGGQHEAHLVARRSPRSGAVS